MKTLLIAMISFLALQTMAAPSIQVLDEKSDRLTSYATEELDGPLANWVIDGKVYPLKEAKRLILEEGKVACATWLMNYSDQKDVAKIVLQESLLQQTKTIPHWKSVNGRPIYVDEATSYALSFVCASKDENGQLIEVESADFQKIFSGLYRFID